MSITDGETLLLNTLSELDNNLVSIHDARSKPLAFEQHSCVPVGNIVDDLSQNRSVILTGLQPREHY